MVTMPRNPYFNPAKFHHTKTGFRNPEGSLARPQLGIAVAKEVA